MQPKSNQYCTFWIDEYLFAIEVSQVQEVLRGYALTSVPLAPSVIGGLMNLRGQIVMAIDLRTRSELPARNCDSPLMNVIVRTRDGLISFLVDRIGDVLTLDERDIDALPANLDGLGRELLLGTVQRESHLVLLLDVRKCIELQSFFDKKRREENLSSPCS